jgi:hypothetical protein
MEVAIIRAVFMKIKMNNRDLLDIQQRIVAYLDSIQARLAPVRKLQSLEGDASQSATPCGCARGGGGVAPAFWADAAAVL